MRVQQLHIHTSIPVVVDSKLLGKPDLYKVAINIFTAEVYIQKNKPMGVENVE